MQFVRVVFAPLLFASVLAAQAADAQADEQTKKVRAAYHDFVDQRDNGAQKLKDLTERMKALPVNSKERSDLVQEAEKIRRESKAPSAPFLEEFRKADWTKFDPKADESLLREGLTGVSRDRADPQKAIAAGREYLLRWSTDRVAAALRSHYLPMALLALDKPDEAAGFLREAADGGQGAVKAAALLSLGDLTAVRGDATGAAKVYAEVDQAGDKNSKEFAALRSAVVGKPAPELDSKVWIGAEPTPLSRMKGKVVMLGFWATWSPTCRAAVQDWNAARDQFAAQGFECLGVTRFFGHGYLPSDEGQILNGGRSFQGMKAEEFGKHVADYHTNTKTHFPFVVAEEADFKNYRVLPMPTVVLVGRDGNVAMVSTSPEFDELVKFGVRHLLGAK